MAHFQSARAAWFGRWTNFGHLRRTRSQIFYCTWIRCHWCHDLQCCGSWSRWCGSGSGISKILGISESGSRKWPFLFCFYLVIFILPIRRSLIRIRVCERGSEFSKKAFAMHTLTHLISQYFWNALWDDKFFLYFKGTMSLDFLPSFFHNSNTVNTEVFSHTISNFAEIFTAGKNCAVSQNFRHWFSWF